jgi:hypothetical protein
MLEEVAGALATERGSLVMVAGEAGIGKTSLVRALRERVAGRGYSRRQTARAWRRILRLMQRMLVSVVVAVTVAACAVALASGSASGHPARAHLSFQPALRPPFPLAKGLARGLGRRHPVPQAPAKEPGGSTCFVAAGGSQSCSIKPCVEFIRSAPARPRLTGPRLGSSCASQPRSEPVSASGLRAEPVSAPSRVR